MSARRAIPFLMVLQQESPDGVPEGPHIICRDRRIQPVLSGRLDLACHNLTFEFLRDGRIVSEQARATLIRTETVPAAPTCVRWVERVVDPQRGTTVRECVQYQSRTRAQSWRIGGQVQVTPAEPDS